MLRNDICFCFCFFWIFFACVTCLFCILLFSSIHVIHTYRLLWWVFFCFLCISLWVKWCWFCPYRHTHTFLSNFTIPMTFSTYICNMPIFLFFSDTIFWWIATICANEYRTLQKTMLIDQLKIWHYLIYWVNANVFMIFFSNRATIRNWWNAFAKKRISTCQYISTKIWIANLRFSKLYELSTARAELS